MRDSTQVWIATIPAVVLSGVGVLHLIKWVKTRGKANQASATPLQAPPPVAAQAPAASSLQAPPPAEAQAPSRAAALDEQGVAPPARGSASSKRRVRVKFKKPQLRVINGGIR